MSMLVAALLVFFDWQNSGLTPGVAPYNRFSPNLALIRDELGKRFGGVWLGGYGVRPIRGGTKPSSHGFGAAFDWRINDRAVMLACIDWLIANHVALGVQAVHDYEGGRIWRANRYPGQPVMSWWRPQQKSATTGMGQSWAKWIHIETTPGRWGDTTPIVQRLAGVTAPAPVFDPANGVWGLWPLNRNKPTLVEIDAAVTDAEHDATRYLQGVLRRKAGQPIAVDGDFGRRTGEAVENLQRFFGLKVDRIVGPKTWSVIDFLATR